MALDPASVLRRTDLWLSEGAGTVLPPLGSANGQCGEGDSHADENVLRLSCAVVGAAEGLVPCDGLGAMPPAAPRAVSCGGAWHDGRQQLHRVDLPCERLPQRLQSAGNDAHERFGRGLSRHVPRPAVVCGWNRGVRAGSLALSLELRHAAESRGDGVCRRQATRIAMAHLAALGQSREPDRRRERIYCVGDHRARRERDRLSAHALRHASAETPAAGPGSPRLARLLAPAMIVV